VSEHFGRSGVTTDGNRKETVFDHSVVLAVVLRKRPFGVRATVEA